MNTCVCAWCLCHMNLKSTPASYKFHGALGGSRPVLVRGQKRGEGEGARSCRSFKQPLSRVRTHDANQPSLRSHLLPAFMSRPDHGAAQNMECKRSRSVHSALTTRPSCDAPRPNPLNEVALCSEGESVPCPREQSYSLPPFQTVARFSPSCMLVVCARDDAFTLRAPLRSSRP